MIKKEHVRADAKSNGNLVNGMAALVGMIYEGRDVSPMCDELLARVSANPEDAAALLDLSVILLTLGQKDKAATVQQAALEWSRSFEIRHGRGTGLRILAFVAPGDFMANTPIDFLLAGSDATLLLRYVDADTKVLDDIPVHDVAFVAIGESEANRPVLENLERLLRSLERADPEQRAAPDYGLDAGWRRPEHSPMSLRFWHLQPFPSRAIRLRRWRRVRSNSPHSCRATPIRLS